MLKDKINIKTTHRFRQKDDSVTANVRQQHKVYFSTTEWDIVCRMAERVNRTPSVYLREVALAYKPAVPDPEFRHGLMCVGDDIRKLFAYLKGMNLTEQERYQFIGTIGFMGRWVTGVKRELDFIEKWIKRV